MAKYQQHGTLINANYLTPRDFSQPSGITVNGAGEIFVVNNAMMMNPNDSEQQECTVSKFTADGTLLGANLINFESFANGWAYGLAIDSQDNIFVGKYNGDTIGKYRPDGSAVNAAFITGLTSVTKIAIQPVPEPATLALIVTGACGGIAALQRRRAGAAIRPDVSRAPRG